MKKGFSRVQFDFTDEALERFEVLMKSMEAPTKAEVIRRVVKFYEMVHAKHQEGYSVELRKGDERLILPMELL